MKRIIKWFKEWWVMIDEMCPNCGYYCHGKSIFCTKHPDGPQKNVK